jgi:hypothetical protein
MLHRPYYFEITQLKCVVPNCWNRRAGGFLECNLHLPRAAVPMTFDQIQQYHEATAAERTSRRSGRTIAH